MKKKRLLLAMAVTLCLTGCDVWQINDQNGNQAIVKLGDGTYYTANELFKDYTGTAAGAAEYYDAVYNVLVRLVQPKTTAINNDVQTELDSFTESCRTTAANNGTLYSTELSKALEEKKVETLAELEQLYYLDHQKKTYEATYYDSNVSESLLKEYVKYYAPYHIRHILVQTSASSSLYEGCISSDDAKNLSSIVTRLASGRESFGIIAQTTASLGDTESAKIYGDVGIMDTTTGFVPEFKYSIYQFDKYLNGKKDEIETFDKTQDERVTGSKECGTEETVKGAHLIPETAEDKLFDNGKLNVNLIPFDVFDSLNKVANLTTNENGYAVYDGKEKYFPRNYLYNKYLNKHQMGFIVKDNATENEGFTSLMINGENHKVLCDENKNPIIVTKAGTGNGESGYQGIHLIIIQKSAFDTDTVAYYDTTIPTTEEEKNKTSYVTFLNTDTDTYSKRAEKIKEGARGFDKNISYRIFEQAFENAKKADSKLTIEANVQESIKNYIKANRSSTAYLAKDEYEDSWKNYVNLLDVQDLCEPLKVSTTIDGDANMYKEYYTSFTGVAGLYGFGPSYKK